MSDLSPSRCSTIESLTVELWRDLFDHFKTNELLYTFRDLNTKISLIIDHSTQHLNTPAPNLIFYRKQCFPAPERFHLYSNSVPLPLSILFPLKVTQIKYVATCELNYNDLASG
ncbi:unnamed protein product [Didymodactylos carnosus]|uniref:Uncharacterized protein n=1 Tax=Didymodactylos carnosus TaxID=1234261 RepID=A0A815J017_9BILA|nr:unnamed protein product [Didymodactylos carnosus]CAF1372448.1 unnamed protein product [Didymodactylos carnosus]CAF3650530.1 unnamed protein product [Didymodactylos carnosus]CAF4260206.1 unnamed protein product [Didymodactylos carnosus]